MGNYGLAVDLVVESRDLARQRGDERSTILMGNNLAAVLLNSGASADAKTLLPDLAAGALRLRDGWIDYYVLGTSAEMFAELGEGEAAARLLAASDVILERLGARANR